MIRARVIGTGAYLPARVMSNDDLARIVDTSDAWIVERTGIRQRHIAAEGELTSDLASAAARAALASAGLGAGSLDLIVVATSTPDHTFPACAAAVQRKLGALRATAFDLQAVCSGFIYALAVADKFLVTGQARTALVLGAETFSRLLDWHDRTTCVLFGDGAGAVLLKAADEPGVISAHSHADGAYEELLQVPAGVSSGYDRVRAEAAFIEMQGREVFRRAVATLDAIATETLVNNGFTNEDVTWLIPHQANMRIISAAAKKLDLPMARVVVTVDEHANTSSASIPLALDVAVRDGRVKRGDLLLFEAFGAGFTWGSALVRY
jgi:3-oxoacyl-[acyl-carrier-protein] synthase-3